MKTIEGKSVYGGIAIGRLFLYEQKEPEVKKYAIENPADEIVRYQQAKTKGVEELGQLYEKAKEELGQANADIFQVHQMMMEDWDYCESVANIITTQKVNAEYAVATTGENFAEMFASMDDSYMRERAADVRDISNRLVRILCCGGHSTLETAEPVIIAAKDLAPSETVQMDKEKILGFVTAAGSSNSHTAILARTMNLPAVIGTGVEIEARWDGIMAVIDGFEGRIYLDPDEETLSSMRRRQEEDRQAKELLLKYKGKQNVTLDGQKINIYANIGSFSDVGAVLKNDAGGIGLFRSEFLYLESESYPTEEQQFLIYKRVVENMAGKKVIFRTLDIGADKQVGYFELPKEENPALGYRAIRICLTRPEIFKTQLRALLRASAFGNMGIMFPMITSVQEVMDVKKIVQEVKNELAAEGIAYSDKVELGVMIETPAAALISDELAPLVDFFSIGTNDLTQYTLAIDRQNEKLDAFYNAHHKAVLRLIKLAADNAHKNGIWIGICGELGADMELTELFLSMGIDELSVSPGCVLGLRKKVCETDVGKVRDACLRQL